MLLYVLFPGRRIIIITDAFDHELVIKNVTLINLCSMPMSQLLEALNSDEVNLQDYDLFVTILGYNNLELDKDVLRFTINTYWTPSHANLHLPNL